LKRKNTNFLENKQEYIQDYSKRKTVPSSSKIKKIILLDGFIKGRIPPRQPKKKFSFAVGVAGAL